MKKKARKKKHDVRSGMIFEDKSENNNNKKPTTTSVDKIKNAAGYSNST